MVAKALQRFKTVPWVLGRQRLGSQIVASRNIEAGSIVWETDFEPRIGAAAVRSRADRHTIQVRAGLHLNMRALCPGSELVQHSCAPNSRLVFGYLKGPVSTLKMETTEPVGPHGVLTFDYNTTEWEMSDPFECSCGSKECAGTVGGYSKLTLERRERIQGDLSHHIRAMARRLDIVA